jgi:hypothetical protein
MRQFAAPVECGNACGVEPATGIQGFKLGVGEQEFPLFTQGDE